MLIGKKIKNIMPDVRHLEGKERKVFYLMALLVIKILYQW
jgi:hypothetical protein